MQFILEMRKTDEHMINQFSETAAYFKSMPNISKKYLFIYLSLDVSMQMS